MSNKQPTIADSVLGQIKSGKVQMKPSIYFTLLSIASLVASLVAGIAMAYLSSIVFFWFKIMNASGNAYGVKNNFSQAVNSFPWWTILIFILSTVFIVFIIRRFGTAYRHKTRNIVLIVVVISIIVGFALSNFGVGDLNHSTKNQQNNQTHGPWWKNK
jgi:glucan phosphoethanolaminetransferase (alkaline phosphatase superfamily)